MKINSIQTHTNISNLKPLNRKEINKNSISFDYSLYGEKSKEISFSGLFSLSKAPFDGQLVESDIKMLPGKDYTINEDTVFDICGYPIDLQEKEYKKEIRALRHGESFIIGRNAVQHQAMPGVVSRQHLQIKKSKNGTLLAQDLNSTNGTSIKKNIKEIPLNIGNQVLEPGEYHLLPFNAVVSMHNTLLFLDDYKEKIQSLPNDRELILGRNQDCDITINDKYVSGQHLAIRPYKGYALVKDLNSTNGSRYIHCAQGVIPRSNSYYANDFYNITDTTELQKGIRTRIPNNCQIYLGNHFTIDVRNPNILESLNKKGKIRIGRSEKCDLVVDKFYSHVSREHLELEKIGNNIIATDLSPTTATQIIPKNRIKAFNGGVSNIELGQQNIGDCFLLSSIYALSLTRKGQQYLESMVRVDDEGNYVVNFYEARSPISVKPEELDGQKYKDTEKRNVSGDLGIRALERAYGKLVKGFFGGEYTLYMKIDDGGYPDTALRKMTGIESRKEHVKEGKIQRTLQHLCSSGLDNYVLTCSTPNKDKFSGYVDAQQRFNKNHAYGIKNINPYHQTIEIVNPHNTMQTQTIAWDEFAQLFDYIYIGEFRK